MFKQKLFNFQNIVWHLGADIILAYSDAAPNSRVSYLGERKFLVDRHAIFGSHVWYYGLNNSWHRCVWNGFKWVPSNIIVNSFPLKYHVHDSRINFLI